MISVKQNPYCGPAFRRVWRRREQLAGQGQFPASKPVKPQNYRIEVSPEHCPDRKPARANQVCFIRNSPNCLHPATPLSWWQQVDQTRIPCHSPGQIEIRIWWTNSSCYPWRSKFREGDTCTARGIHVPDAPVMHPGFWRKSVTDSHSI